MRIIQSDYHDAGDRVTVRLLFKAREQLLDPEDPSLPPRQELTEEAEAAIITSTDAVPLKRPATLEIRVAGSPDPGSLSPVPDAIRHHFRYLLAEHEKEWAIFLRRRRVSLAFTVMNLLIAFLYLVTLYENEAFMMTFAGLLTGAVIVILNWTTIWGTYEFFIYEGLEKKHRKKLLQKILGSEIRVSPA